MEYCLIPDFLRPADTKHTVVSPHLECIETPLGFFLDGPCQNKISIVWPHISFCDVFTLNLVNLFKKCKIPECIIVTNYVKKFT